MPTRFSVTLSDELHEVARILRRRNHYRTLTEYFEGLIRDDGQGRREHRLTAEWAELSGDERDALDKAILRKVRSNDTTSRAWLEAKIEACIMRHVQNGKEPASQQVAEEVAKEIAEEYEDQ